jgi:DNA-binding transcriptional regulator LsrR (DeoR family)
MNNDRDTLLAEIASRYYVHDQSQQEIADHLGISRSNISRLLKEAREQGIVEIFVRHPLGRDSHLERQLMDRFSLREVGVVQALFGEPQATLDQTAKLAARLLDTYLPDAQVLGISWGTTLHAITQVFAPQRRYDVEVVQMMGGIGSSDPTIDGPALTQQIAQALTNRYRYLHAPLIVDSSATAQALLAQNSIAETLSVAARADVALVGIGAMDPSISSLMRAGYLKPEEFQTIHDAGAVGDICARHYDISGRSAAPEIDKRMIAITLDELAHIPIVVGVASGVAKARAILGALCGGYIDVLITDTAAAEMVLALATTPATPLDSRAIRRDPRAVTLIDEER